MAAETGTLAILLRAIGPATHKLMSMADWRAASEATGFLAPETLVNTGNMIAGFSGDEAEAAARMTAVLRGFGLGENVVPIVRRRGVLEELVAADPVAQAAAERVDQTGVYFFAASAPDFGWLADYDGPEKVHVVHGHLVIDFGRDVAKSSRLMRLVDRHCGVNTARNWNSVRRIAERCRARGKD